MADLHEESHAALDISSGGAVLTYTYTGAAPKSVLARIEVGSPTAPIAAGGNYVVRSSLNGKRLSPDSNVTVAAGIDETVLQSREILLRNGDALIVVVDGDAADLAVATTAVLIDLTPLTEAEVYGTGSVLVDHDYGSADALAYKTSAGRGIDNATVQAFLKSDWDAGRRGANYIQGSTTTNTRGRWLAPILLDPDTYVILCFRQGSYGPDTRTVVVT